MLSLHFPLFDLSGADDEKWIQEISKGCNARKGTQMYLLNLHEKKHKLWKLWRARQMIILFREIFGNIWWTILDLSMVKEYNYCS